MNAHVSQFRMFCRKLRMAICIPGDAQENRMREVREGEGREGEGGA